MDVGGVCVEFAKGNRDVTRDNTVGGYWGAMAGLALLLCASFLASLSLGSVRIPVSDVVGVLLGGHTPNEQWVNIIYLFRVPKSITALIAGAALAVSGLQMQTLFRNPLAGPFVLGINAAASLGVAIAIVGLGTAGMEWLSHAGVGQHLGVVVAAMLGAGMVMGLVLATAQRIRDPISILILGLMFGYAASAIVSVIVYFGEAQKIQKFLLWSFGSFGGVTPSQLRVFVPVVLLGLVVAGGTSKAMGALLLGEDYASSMGVSLKRTRSLIILSTCMLAGSVTAFCGPIAFLGLAVPHLCRALLGTAEPGRLLPAVILVGGSLALLSDIVAQLPGSDSTLPLNAVASFVGAPVVIWVVMKRRNLKGLT